MYLAGAVFPLGEGTVLPTHCEVYEISGLRSETKLFGRWQQRCSLTLSVLQQLVFIIITVIIIVVCIIFSSLFFDFYLGYFCY